MGLRETLLAMFTVHAWFRDDVNFTHGVARVARVLAVIASFFMLGFSVQSWTALFVGMVVVYAVMTVFVWFVAGHPNVN